MGDLNCVTIIGRLTQDVKFTTLKDGKNVCKFSVANNTTPEKVIFFEVEAWNKLAEICNKYLKKGELVSISGKLSESRWEKDGKQNRKMFITADEVNFISTGKKKEQGDAAEPLPDEINFTKEDDEDIKMNHDVNSPLWYKE